MADHFVIFRPDTGDEAEADSLEAARLAARTLIEDNPSPTAEAHVYAPDGLNLTTARFNEHGELVFHGSTLDRKYRKEHR